MGNGLFCSPSCQMITETLFPNSICFQVTDRPDWVRSFSKPKTSPTDLSLSTTGLSVYIRFGCLSVRTMWWTVVDAILSMKCAPKPTAPPVSLHGQLLMREFYYLAASVTPNFDKTKVGNLIYPCCALSVDGSTFSFAF